MSEQIKDGDPLPRGWKAALVYAINTLDSEIDIRDNDDTGNREMKKNRNTLRKLLLSLAAREAKS